MDTASEVKPLARQLKIRNACIAVEKSFCGEIDRLPYAMHIVPATLVLALPVLNGMWHFAPGLLLAPFAIVAACIALVAVSRRFHAIGKSATNMLKIIAPLFVLFWICPKMTETYHVRQILAAVLALWPAVQYLILLFKPSGKPFVPHIQE